MASIDVAYFCMGTFYPVEYWETTPTKTVNMVIVRFQILADIVIIIGYPHI